MSARHVVEDLFCELLTQAETAATETFPDGLHLGCEVIPGRTKRKYPPCYVAVNGDEEQSRTRDGRVWLVDATIWVVTQVDDPGALEGSKERLRKLTRWFGVESPAHGYRDADKIITGVILGECRTRNASYTWADILSLRVGVVLRS